MGCGLDVRYRQAIPGSGIGYVSKAGNHPDIAERLATMAELYENVGRSGDFASFMSQIRQDYRTRPSLTCHRA